MDRNGYLLRDCGTDIEAIGGTINTKAFKKSRQDGQIFIGPERRLG